MTEMIERVARAIDPDEWALIDSDAALAYDAKGLSLERARAAIVAMREPTEWMGAQGSRVEITAACWADPEPHHASLSESEMQRIAIGDRLHGNPARWSMPTYRAMIDAALSDPAPGRTTG